MPPFFWIALAAILCAVGQSSVPASAESGSPKIGAILPLTGDGAFWGTNPRNGIELARKDLTHAPSVIYEDDRCDPAQAVSAFHRLVDVEKVRIIFGPACSSATLAIAPLAKEKNVLLLAFSESDSIPTGKNILRLWVPNGAQGKKLAQHIYRERGIKSLAVLSVQNAFGVDLAKALKEEFVALGGTISVHEEYSPGSGTFRAQLLKLKSKNPDGFFFASYIADGVSIMREAHELRFEMPIFGPSTINSPDFFGPLQGIAGGLEFADLTDTTSEEFRKRWKAEYNQDWPGIQSGAPLFYDAMTAVGTWLKTHPADPEQLREYLLSNTLPAAASGSLAFDAGGNLNRTHAIYFVDQRGKAEISPM